MDVKKMLLDFFITIYNVFLPISFPVIGGALLFRFLKMDTKALSLLSLFVLSPALIFESMYKAQITFSDVSSILLFSITNLLILWACAFFLGKMYSLSSSEKAGLTMVSTFTNCVNYGLPLVLLAFGQIGLDIAAIYVIVQIILVNTVGVYFAARSHFSIKQAARSVLTMPSLYAASIAILFRLLHVQLPDSMEKGIVMLSQSYSPVVLAILGAQMVGAKRILMPETYQKVFWAGLLMRLFAAPLLAYVILSILSVKGTLFSVLLLLASMPAAVNAVILAERFNAAPQLVSKCIVWTTFASFLVLPFILKVLN
jgi:malate permease and related proteins